MAKKKTTKAKHPEAGMDALLVQRIEAESLAKAAELSRIDAARRRIEAGALYDNLHDVLENAIPLLPEEARGTAIAAKRGQIGFQIRNAEAGTRNAERDRQDEDRLRADIDEHHAALAATLEAMLPLLPEEREASAEVNQLRLRIIDAIVPLPPEPDPGA